MGGVSESLKNLKAKLEDNKTAMVNSLGVTPFRKSPVDQTAIMWAKQHPQDPRSVQILQKNGIK
jgi:protein-tyrosine-phosphatase